MWYCLPDSLSLLVYNPETSSRVTLALLGTVFQTALTVLARHVQNQSRITRCDGSVLHWFCFYVNWYAPLRRFDLYGLPLLYGLSEDYLLLGYIQRRTGARKNPKKNQDQVYLRFRKSVKKIKSVASVLSVSHFERMRTEPQGEGAM